MATSRETRVPNGGVLFGPVLYFVCYVVVHVLQILYLEARTVDLGVLVQKEFWERFHSSLLSAFTVGLCSSLLMLSLATALRQRISELAMAAPASLFRIFTIFVVGQTLILIAGHSAIFAAALSAQAADADASAGYLAWTEYVVVLTVFVAVASLWLLETYLSRVYARLAHVFPVRAMQVRKHTRTLALLALFSLGLIVLKVMLSAASISIHGPTVSLVVAIFEVFVFGLTIYVSLSRDHGD